MKFPIDLYKKDTPRWIWEDEDTLIWAGVGGEVILSIKELKNVLNIIKRLKDKESNLSARSTEPKLSKGRKEKTK